MNRAVQQLREAIERLLHVGQAEGIEPDGPLGAWLEAQAQALSSFAEVLAGETDRFAEVLAGVRAANEGELAQVRELKLAVEVINAQARNVHLVSIVQQEESLQRMMKEMLPRFADSLKSALVIRESRWNRDQARKRFGLAGLVFLGVFVAGCGLATWYQADEVAAYDRCTASEFTARDGHIYCLLDQAAAGGSDTSAAGTGR
jgi:hypothetical protein